MSECSVLQHMRLLHPWDFPGKGTGVGCQFPSPEDLPDPEIEPGSPILQADALPSEPPGEKAIVYLTAIINKKLWSI